MTEFKNAIYECIQLDLNVIAKRLSELNLSHQSNIENRLRSARIAYYHQVDARCLN